MRYKPLFGNSFSEYFRDSRFDVRAGASCPLRPRDLSRPHQSQPRSDFPPGVSDRPLCTTCSPSQRERRFPRPRGGADPPYFSLRRLRARCPASSPTHPAPKPALKAQGSASTEIPLLPQVVDRPDPAESAHFRSLFFGRGTGGVPPLRARVEGGAGGRRGAREHRHPHFTGHEHHIRTMSGHGRFSYPRTSCASRSLRAFISDASSQVRRIAR